ncbi:CDGSH iron-sulfur domain-containing protein [Thalassoglobus sp.]|uniref:CDGSH iron-sulfur domain-containing protein n=1 Tax=Thalassoglobus sp. TaxID=2795869 RepID=UPI003AA8D068
MSELPKIAGRQPAKVMLEAGKKYAYCTCGLSENQPFCNGAHKGTGFNPIVFTAEADGEVKLCQCKQTQSAPRCDGQHNCLES